jgi:hypothetical protein
LGGKKNKNRIGGKAGPDKEASISGCEIGSGLSFIPMGRHHGREGGRERRRGGALELCCGNVP